MHIPFVDLKLQYQQLKTEIDQAIFSVIENTAFIGNSGNKYVKRFEGEFASYLNVKHCIACANGTDSLEIILKGMGIGHGDEVIVPALSWISTSEAVSNIGAKPVFVDIEPEYYTINVDLIEEKINQFTKAIIPVHLYGHPVDMDKIMSLARKYGLKVIEDCAQAHGAEINGRVVGSIGDAGSFSFFPGKNLGAYGDAGGIVTNDDKLAEQCRMISQHGQKEKKHVHYLEGRNSRMDGIQAAILSVKLPHLDEWTSKRIEISEIYSDLLKGVLKTPLKKSNVKHVFHLYIIEHDDRDSLISLLESESIQTAIQYPTALPFLDAYKERGFSQKDFPVASNLTKRIFSLPIYPELTREQIEFIVSVIKSQSNFLFIV